MIQTPVPPLPPGLDPNMVFNEIVPLVAFVVVVLVGAVVLRGLLRTPVGEALAERIRSRTGRRGGGGSGDPERVAALEAQVAQLQGQVSELAERIDFAERVLAEGRARKLGQSEGAHGNL